MELGHNNPEYRSAKSASRKVAAELAAMSELPDSGALEQTSQYNPDRHEPQPRVIETKPERFAIEGHFIAKVAELALTGEGNESRLPALQAQRGRIHRAYRPDEHLEVLMEDWLDADYSHEVSAVLNDPGEAANLARYDEIVQDIATDPGAKGDPFLGSETGREEAETRINPANSWELANGGYFLIKWTDQLMNQANASQTAEERRAFLIDNLDFLDQIAQLELTHSEKYFWKKWRDNLVITASEAGVQLLPDANGKLKLRLVDKEKPPTITMGPTVGCPAGFDINPAGTAIRRLGIAYINEAYDRGLLEPVK